MDVLSQNIQDNFVFLAITDTDFLKIARDIVKPQYFSSQVTEDIIQICYSFYDQFKESPVNHLQDELFRFLQKKSETEKKYYIDYLLKIQDLPKPNYAYIIKKINEFVQAREFENAAVKFVEMVEVGKFEEAKELMLKSLKVGFDRENIGLDYFKAEAPLFTSSMFSEEVIIPSGFDVLDQYIKGFKRGEFVCILGGYKGKKSWYCQYLGRLGLLHGKKVLHITHENGLEETEKRYDMILSGFTSDTEPKLVTYSEIDDEGVVKRTWTANVNTVYDIPKTMENRKKWARYGGKLIIKKYPMHSCSLGEFERYIEYLEIHENFVPDIIINDYVECMKLPTANNNGMVITDEAYGRMKGIADAKNCLVVTVSQVQRGALRIAKLKQNHFQGDIRKLGKVDKVIAISQTEHMAQQNKMIAYVLANRNGVMDIGCCFTTNLDVGQMVTNCWPLRERDLTEEGSEQEE